jgi:hypothetical protein
LRSIFPFENLYSRDGLARLDAAFVAFLGEASAALRERLVSARSDPAALAPLQESDLLVALSPHVDDFVARLFGIEAEVRALAALTTSSRRSTRSSACSCSAARCTRSSHRTRRRSISIRFSALHSPSSRSPSASPNGSRTRPRTPEKLELAARYAAWAAGTAEGREKHRHGVLFKTPRKLDYMRLVPVRTDETQGYARHSLDHLRRREGFALTDAGTDLVGALDEAHYCIWCHEQGKDSCFERVQGEGARRRIPQDGVRRSARRVPAGREDFRIPHGQDARRSARRARDDRRRQPDGRRLRATGSATTA